jgi:hypothetical protein
MKTLAAALWMMAGVVTFATLGCKGDVGPTGPAGASGTNGANGNANVVTGAFILKDSAYVTGFWTVSTGPGSILGLGAKIASVPVPAVTAGIMDSGAVLLYIANPVGLTTDSIQWTPMPYSYSPFEGDYLVRFDFGAATGTINVAYMFQPTDAASAPPPIFGSVVPTQEFKYVAIAGTTAAALSAAHVNLANYAQVMAALRAM